MNTHLCYRCARGAGYSSDAETELLLESDYQVEKFMKHTRPHRIYHFNSLFDDPSSDAYRDYVLNGAAAGSVEIHPDGKVSFTWVAGTTLGATFQDGALLYPDDAVKIVLPFDEDKIHAYPVSSTGLTSAYCANCGAPILR